MSVRLEFFSVVIPIQNIDRCYPGGFSAFVKERLRAFGSGYWHDDHLFRTGAMSGADVRIIIKEWEQRGLVPTETVGGQNQWKDLCAVDYYDGPSLPCPWLGLSRRCRAVYLKGFPEGRVIGREEMRKVYREHRKTDMRGQLRRS